VSANGNGKGLRGELLIVICTAALAFFGGIGGSWCGSTFELRRWRTQADYAARQERVKMRAELVERVIRLSARLDDADVIVAMNNHAVHEASASQRAGQETLSILEKGSAGAQKLNELEGDFAVTLSLVAIYFGGPVREHAHALAEAVRSTPKDTRRWWNFDRRLLQNLVDSMAAELLAEQQRLDASVAN
jgi:hypothetical protein